MFKLIKKCFPAYFCMFNLSGCAESRGYIDLSEIVKNDLK